MTPLADGVADEHGDEDPEHHGPAALEGRAHGTTPRPGRPRWRESGREHGVRDVRGDTGDPPREPGGEAGLGDDADLVDVGGVHETRRASCWRILRGNGASTREGYTDGSTGPLSAPPIQKDSSQFGISAPTRELPIVRHVPTVEGVPVPEPTSPIPWSRADGSCRRSSRSGNRARCRESHPADARPVAPTRSLRAAPRRSRSSPNDSVPTRRPSPSSTR